SQDGTQLAFIDLGNRGSPQLFVRAINSLEVRPVNGTDGAETPFFSPDGQWIGFVAEGKLRKTNVRTGSVQTICECITNVPSPRGARWAVNDAIFFSSPSGIMRVNAAGGQVEAVTRLDREKGEVSHRMPQVLPGGKVIIYTVWTGPGDDE